MKFALMVFWFFLPFLVVEKKPKHHPNAGPDDQMLNASNPEEAVVSPSRHRGHGKLKMYVDQSLKVPTMMDCHLNRSMYQNKYTDQAADLADPQTQAMMMLHTSLMCVAPKMDEALARKRTASLDGLDGDGKAKQDESEENKKNNNNTGSNESTQKVNVKGMMASLKKYSDEKKSRSKSNDRLASCSRRQARNNRSKQPIDNVLVVPLVPVGGGGKVANSYSTTSTATRTTKLMAASKNKIRSSSLSKRRLNDGNASFKQTSKLTTKQKKNA